jgi:hypothetical protein
MARRKTCHRIPGSYSHRQDLPSTSGTRQSVFSNGVALETEVSSQRPPPEFILQAIIPNKKSRPLISVPIGESKGARISTLLVLLMSNLSRMSRSHIENVSKPEVLSGSLEREFEEVTVSRTVAPTKQRIALEPNLSQELWKFL